MQVIHIKGINRTLRRRVWTVLWWRRFAVRIRGVPMGHLAIVGRQASHLLMNVAWSRGWLAGHCGARSLLAKQKWWMTHRRLQSFTMGRKRLQARCRWCCQIGMSVGSERDRGAFISTRRLSRQRGIWINVVNVSVPVFSISMLAIRMARAFL